MGFWKNYGFEIMLVISVIAIVIFVISALCKKKKGTYNTYKIDPSKGFNTKRMTKAELYDYLHSTDKSQRAEGAYAKSTSRDRVGRGPKESSGEKECRRVLQEIFRRPFEKARPDFLRNNVTGGNFNLELDCYEPSLGIAVEYNGVQHYKYVPYFHKNKEAFYNQKYRDDMKRRICKDNGIKLIEVPYTVKNHEIADFIKRQLNP